MSKYSIIGPAAFGLLSVGCSLDRHVYYSHPLHPATVTVFNSYTEEPLWSYDVPPGHKIILDYDTDVTGNIKYSPGAARPTEMKWYLYPDDVYGFHDAFPFGRAEAKDVVALPGVGVRDRLTLRPAEISQWESLPEGYDLPPIEPATQEANSIDEVGDATNLIDGARAEEAAKSKANETVKEGVAEELVEEVR